MGGFFILFSTGLRPGVEDFGSSGLRDVGVGCW